LTGFLETQAIEKRWGHGVTVGPITLDIASGEILALLGPSGSGKTTMLRLLAGFETADGGRIAVAGEDVTTVPPARRRFGMVFQHYALFPHLDVGENVGFGLQGRGKGDEGRAKQQISEALALVDLAGFERRKVHELSGGQQQRVALARTLVYQPNLLLLDEPLSNLDAKLRLRARGWLKQLQLQLGLTTIFVTHDQTEALSLSDRIMVMDGGRIIQVGAPQEVYRDPATPFIADFIGGSNFLAGTVVTVTDGRALLSLPDGQTLSVAAGREVVPGRQVTVSVRPEAVHLVQAGDVGSAEVSLLHGRIVQREYLGPRYQYAVSIADRVFRFEAIETLGCADATVTVPAESCTVFTFNGTA